MLAYQDVRQRYVRSVLGEFWISLSLGISIITIGTLYGGIFGFDLGDYLPYLAAGIAGWTLISSALNEGAQAFIADYQLLLQTSLPKSLYVFRVLLRTLIVYTHNLVIVMLVCIATGLWPTWSWLAAVPNCVLVLVNIAWMSLALSIVATRYRDIPPILSNVLQILFFLTPIIWKAGQAPEHLQWINYVNPFAALVDLLRAPFLGATVSVGTYVAAVTLAVIGWALTVALYARSRHRIVYWL